MDSVYDSIFDAWICMECVNLNVFECVGVFIDSTQQLYFTSIVEKLLS